MQKIDALPFGVIIVVEEEAECADTLVTVLVTARLLHAAVQANLLETTDRVAGECGIARHPLQADVCAQCLCVWEVVEPAQVELVRIRERQLQHARTLQETWMCEDR